MCRLVVHILCVDVDVMCMLFRLWCIFMCVDVDVMWMLFRLVHILCVWMLM